MYRKSGIKRYFIQCFDKISNINVLENATAVQYVNHLHFYEKSCQIKLLHWKLQAPCHRSACGGNASYSSPTKFNNNSIWRPTSYEIINIYQKALNFVPYCIYWCSYDRKCPCSQNSLYLTAFSNNINQEALTTHFYIPYKILMSYLSYSV